MLDARKLERLASLTTKINEKTANTIEQKEYMQLLFENGSITKKQYDDFLSGKGNTSDFWGFALTIGAILLLGWLINRTGESK